MKKIFVLALIALMTIVSSCGCRNTKNVEKTDVDAELIKSTETDTNVVNGVGATVDTLVVE